MDYKLYKEVFSTEASVAVYANIKHKLTDDKKAIIRSPKFIVVFSLEDYFRYHDEYDIIGISGIDDDELNWLGNNSPHYISIYKNQRVVLFLYTHFFTLRGKYCKKIRKIRNLYLGMESLKVFAQPRNKSDINEFLCKWKKSGKNPSYRNIIGLDKNFFNRYAFKKNANFLMWFFYIEEELVGYSVIEKVSDNHYNHLIRKADRNTNHLALYMDYYVYKEIFESTKESFFMNLGDTGGQPNLLKEKTENFPVFRVYDCNYAYVLTFTDSHEEEYESNGITVQTKQFTIAERKVIQKN